MSDEPEKSKTKKAVREAGHSENVAALSSLLSTPKIEEMAPEERQRHIEAAKPCYPCATEVQVAVGRRC